MLTRTRSRLPSRRTSSVLPTRAPRLAVIGVFGILVGSLIAAPVLWAAGLLDEVEWHDDFVTGVTTGAVVYSAIAVGFVMGRPRALLVVWAVAVAWIVVVEVRREDDPTLSGIDDLSPAIGLPFTPLVMLLPAIGLGLQRWIASRHEPPPSADAVDVAA